MVKAAPRFATILCLCYVRVRCLRVRCVDSTSGLAAAMHVSIRIGGIAVAEGTRTLAMPMGEAVSVVEAIVMTAGVYGVWGAVLAMSSLVGDGMQRANVRKGCGREAIQ